MRYILAFISTAILALAGFLIWAERYQSIKPVEQPVVSSFDSSLISKGKVLVALGDCAVCHTMPGGKSFAGGLKLRTPFGAIYSTNAYLMTRPPVTAIAPPNEMIFPINYRIVMAAWNLFFLHHGALNPDPNKTAQWNRGAYLVEGLGHCGGCHTPRNLMGAEKRGQRYAGGEAEAWHAPALNEESPAPLSWTADALVNYLLDGWDKDHGIAAGPMSEVTNGLSALSEADVSAVAVYILSLQGQSRPKEAADATIAFAREREFDGAMPRTADVKVDGPDANIGRGRSLFVKICSNCHRVGGIPAALALTSTVNGPDPRNLIHVINEGIQPPEGVPDRSMPAFGRSLSDTDLIDLVAFMRLNFSKQPAWKDVAAQVGRIRAARD
jgi:mono/diheme cytochrome c family protein